VDPELTYLKDLELSGAGSADKNDSSYDGRNGVRSIRISPDGKHLASGDRAGNIRYACESLGSYANGGNDMIYWLSLVLCSGEVSSVTLGW